jgi:hypothetical protein
MGMIRIVERSVLAPGVMHIECYAVQACQSSNAAAFYLQSQQMLGTGVESEQQAAAMGWRDTPWTTWSVAFSWSG